jgi:peptidoglycan/LPS O-acetylase OafA/YrhL
VCRTVRSESVRPTPAPDPEERFAVADPGKEWRRGHRIPVVPSFDGYRAYAILFVCLFHIFQVSGAFSAAGDSALGVIFWGILPRSLDVLFIVSGFVIYLPTVVRDGDFGRVSAFAIRRAARLVPAYYVTLLIALLLLGVVASSPGLPDAGTITAHFAVVQTPTLLLVDNFRLGLGVVPPVWTLSVEIGFYVVLPFLAVWYFRHPLVGLAAAAAIVLVWRELAEHADTVAGIFGADLSSDAESRITTFYASQFPSWTLALATGMTGARAYVRLRDGFSPERLAKLAIRVTAIAGALLVLEIYLAGHGAVHDVSPFEGLFARESLLVTLGYPVVLGTVLVGFSLLPERAQLPCSAPVIRWIGDISYAIYLIHFAVIWFLVREFSLPGDGTVLAVLAWCAIVYPVSILYAYLSARFLERPVRRWAHRFGRRAQAPAETAPAGAG